MTSKPKKQERTIQSLPPDQPRVKETAEEKLKTLEAMQRATLNILEDFNAEKSKLETVQSATLNLLEDFDAEKIRLEDTQKATLNILDDFNAEKDRLTGVQRASLNILEDLEAEKDKLDSANTALELKKAEAERANLAKDRFLATMSHELRTPLNAIIGFTGTLLMRLPGPLTADQDTQLKTIQSSARHLLSLINDLLDLAKVESGKVELHFEPVVCQAVLEEVAMGLRSLAEAKGLVFSVKTPSSEVVLNTDRRLLTQILINLVNNAIKFTERGHILVELAQEDRGRDGAVTRISVSDSGIGIRPEEQSRLFQAFVQVGRAGVRRQEGTGLGLHLSQKLAGLLNGTIELKSEPGQGSTFTLVLKGE